jgi:hypothetical protein
MEIQLTPLCDPCYAVESVHVHLILTLNQATRENHRRLKAKRNITTDLSTAPESGESVKADTTAHLSSFTKPSTYRKMQHTGAKPTIYDTLSSTRYLRSQPPTQLADFVAAVTATPTPLGSPSIDV